MSLPNKTPISKTMRCIEIIKPGATNVLQVAHRPIPQPGPNEILIKVAAAGINRPDVFQRKGLYPPPEGASDIPGLEVAGEIVAMGYKDDMGNSEMEEPQWQIGDQVCALLTGGGYAEYALAHRDLCLPIPTNLTPIQAAALPETFFTVWQTVFDSGYGRGAIQQGETLLVHAGTSGIGTTAIQLAKAFGHQVITTSRNDKKCQQCLELGADVAINTQTDDFVTRVKEATQGKGADVILDMVGGDYVQQNIRAAGFRGRIISIAFLTGSKVDLDLMPVMLKQLTLTGSTLRARPVKEKAHIAKALLHRVWPLFTAGSDHGLTPVIHHSFPLEQAAEAHQLMESNQHWGKIVLTINN